MNGLAGCELVVNEWEDEFLDCCSPGNRTECHIINQMVDYDLELFSTSPTKTHSCTSGKIYSAGRNKCVEKFNG